MSVALADIVIAPQFILTNVLVWTINYMPSEAMAGRRGDCFSHTH